MTLLNLLRCSLTIPERILEKDIARPSMLCRDVPSADYKRRKMITLLHNGKGVQGNVFVKIVSAVGAKGILWMVVKVSKD